MNDGFRMYRGGSWHFPAQRARVAYRGRITPDYRGNRVLGLRLARDPMHKLAKAVKDEG